MVLSSPLKACLYWFTLINPFPPNFCALVFLFFYWPTFSERIFHFKSWNYDPRKSLQLINHQHWPKNKKESKRKPADYDYHVFKPVVSELYSAFMAKAIVHKFMFALRIRNSMKFLTLRLPFFFHRIHKISSKEGAAPTSSSLSSSSSSSIWSALCLLD